MEWTGVHVITISSFSHFIIEFHNGSFNYFDIGM